MDLLDKMYYHWRLTNGENKLHVRKKPMRGKLTSKWTKKQNRKMKK